MICIENILNELKKHGVEETKIEEVKRAYLLAADIHKNQYRQSGEPYIIHPVQVAYILANLELDDATICAALLHDVAEDTEVTIQDISREFSDVSFIIVGRKKHFHTSYSWKF